MNEENQRLKSPPYPSLDLERALERAEKLREIAKGFAVPLSSAAKSWGYSATSSSISSVVGALNQFGLIKEIGSGEGRRISLSSLAEAILLDKRPGSIDRVQAVRTAATSPKVFKELWDQYGTWDVDEGTIIFDLTLGRKNSSKAPYSETAAMDVARKYRASLEYAGLDREDTQDNVPTTPDLAITPDAGGAEGGVAAANLGEIRAPVVATPSYQQGAPANLTIFEERKALDEGAAILVWPRDLSPESVEDMEYWLSGVLRQIKRRTKQASD